MRVRPRRVIYAELESGVCPFEIWFGRLKDQGFAKSVAARIGRIRDGNFGDFKSVGDGVFELRINRGPGLRVYFGLSGNDLVLLLGGGEKASQTRDIERAKMLWRKVKDEIQGL